MNDETRQGGTPDRDEETMARLMRLAGPSASIPDDVESRVYERVKSEWRASSAQPDDRRVYAQVRRQWEKGQQRRRLPRWAMPVAVAATVLMAVAFVLQPPPAAPVRLSAGSIVRVVADGGAAGLPAVGDLVYRGDSLSTGSGQGISIRLANSELLLIDEKTTLVVLAEDAFRLLSGRVYADTGDFIYRDHGLVIDTAMGTVTDVGTQFAVAVADDVIDVAVREGRVDISRDAAQFVAVAGERLQIHRDDGAMVDALAAYDAYWDWTISLAPRFDLENKSLLEFLRWAARVTGRELVFETDELRMSAMRTDLHGSVSDFEPLEAIAAVLATTRFKYRIEADRIIIEQ